MPSSFDVLRSQIEENTVPHGIFVNEALDPISRMSDKLDFFAEALFGNSGSFDEADENWWDRHGSIVSAVQSVSNRLTALDEVVAETSGEDLRSQFSDLQASVAERMKASALKAVQAMQAFEERLKPLEDLIGGASLSPDQLLDRIRGSSNPSGSTSPQGPDEPTLASLLVMFRESEAARLRLEKEVQQLRSASNSSGVRIGNMGFDSIEQLIEALDNDGVDPASYDTHVDANSIFCHYADGNAQSEANTAELKAMRSAGINDPISCIYTASFRQKVPPYFLDSGTPVKMGQKFPMLKNRDAWEGPAGIDGGRSLLKKAVKDAYMTTKVYIASHLRAGTLIRELADFCNSQSYEWWISVCTHIDDEILALSKFGISEDKVFELVSDELQIMFREEYEVRMSMEVFSANRHPKRYYAYAIWTTLRCHKIMDQFSEVGFASHVLISSLFTRFLAKQTGENMGAGVMTHITRLEGEIKKVSNDQSTKVKAINTRFDKVEARVKTVETTCAWSTGLVVALLLGLPVEAVYVDAELLCFLEPLLQGFDRSKVFDLYSLSRVYLPDTKTVVVSGTAAWVDRHARRLIQGSSSVMWFAEQPFRGRSFKSMQHGLRSAESACRKWGLNAVRFRHADYGGATNACHVVGFSAALTSWSGDYPHPPGVSRSIRHHWKPAAALQHPVQLHRPLPAVVGDHKRPLMFKDLLRTDGLLPVSSPSMVVCGPTVFYPEQYVRRALTREELLTVFDVPIRMNEVFLEHGAWTRIISLPFETTLSPVVVTSIFRSLWSGVVGDCGEYFVSPSSTAEPKEPEVEMEVELELPPELMLGVNLPPNPGPRSVMSDQSSDWDSSESAMTYKSFDTSSADDSFMPRRKAPTRVAKVEVDWEFLDDASVGSTAAETEETPSESSYLPEEVGSEHSTINSGSDCLDSDADSSIASAETICHVSSATQAMLENVEEAAIGKKAVKADDAGVPVHLWNDRVSTECKPPPTLKREGLDGFRDWGLYLFRRALYLDCLDYLAMEFGSDWRARLDAGELSSTSPSGKLSRLGKELEAVKNILWHANNTNYFEYHAGSRLHHFRFPVRYRREARDGTPIYFEKPGPTTKARQPDIPPEMLDQVASKIQKVIRRRYMTRVTTDMDIKSLIKFFAVPKGERDIRMVYDATASGLNEAVWAPSFWLPTIDSLVRSLDSSSWMTDRDIGDMFLNFPLHESARPYAGVDIKPILTGADAKQWRWYQWVRNAMGFAPSPYNSIKMALVAEEIIKGDRSDKSNPFHWDKVHLNLPGTVNYDPTKSWIMKVRHDGLSASELFTFVDDERVGGATEELTWQSAHTMAAKQAYLGIQDAARKAGECTQQPRAWAGAVVHVVPDKGVCVLTSDEKWQKLKSILAKWLEVLERGDEELDHKELLSDRGFLVYVTRAYPAMVPYVKGFHLTAEMWRGNRDEDGWKLPPDKCKEELPTAASGEVVELDEDEALARYSIRRQFGNVTPHAPPTGKTTPAPRLLADVKALMHLSSEKSPPLRVVRPKRVVHVFYGFGDASGKGRGSTTQGFRTIDHPSQELGPSTGLIYKVGVWGADVDSESSNFRELANLVEDTEAEARLGTLNETEFFLFTDNSTAESAFYKGSSASKKLHSLILRLHAVALKYSIILHLIHVSGKRMIAQGTDGCSRGMLMEGVMAGSGMLSFIDLDKSAIERSPDLLPWIRSWCGHQTIEPLTPEEWFCEGHGIIGGHLDKHGVWIPDHEPSNQMHLWAPAPAVADAMLEELLKARHKRTDTYHVIVIPRLMAPRWRRLFHKVSDLFFAVDPGNSFWPTDMYEPLFVGIVFPFASFRPWCFKRAPLMVEMGREVRRLCKEGDFAPGCLLRKLLKLPRRLARLPASVARGVLHMPREEPVSNGSDDR